MIDYDFSTLNDKEFERLVADILSAKENCHVERFKAGRDGGKDGRFFSPDGGETVIQCKHWLKSGIKALIQHLKNHEVAKVQKISPKRYILATSLDLSDDNKKDIMDVLSPYITTPEDILSKTDLNDFLSKNRELEEKHYKLWLASTNVLKNIFHAAIRGRSKDILDDVRSFSKKYVKTTNHINAFEKLEELHSVIITGEGGIGKTSLANQLAYEYVAREFEFYVIENSVNEAEAEFNKDKKQVFYFDDFLGRNYLTALEKHEDSHIINFINRISKDKKKRFILTSRSTILNQGKTISGLFHINNVDRNEYQIDISSLSEFDKACILYNHIWFGNIKEEHVDEIYKDNRYLKIVRHQNYNPRIISFITDAHKISHVAAQQYWEYIQYRLDNPEDVWADVYDNQIDDLSRLAVLLVVFNGTYIIERDLKGAFKGLAISNGLSGELQIETNFLRTMKQATGAILNRKISSDEIVLYNLFNPAVADFILKRYENNDSVLTNVFLALNTTQSLDNLLALKKNTKIKLNTYNYIIEKITTTRLDQKEFSGHKYKIKLANIVLREQHSIKKNYQNLVNIIANINNYPVFKSIINDTCTLLEWGIDRKVVPEIERIIDNYVVECIKSSIEHDDYVRIGQLIKKRDDIADCNIDIVLEIKEKFISYWQDAINESVDESCILDDFFDRNEQGEAEDKVCEFVRKQFSEIYIMEFSDEDLESVYELVDVQEKMQNNRERASESYEGYRPSSGNGGFPQGSYTSSEGNIIDLFDRG